MYYYIFGITDKGNYREQNEDCILIDHEVINSGSYESTVAAPFIAAVCDGVGGENAGEVASELCLRHLSILEYNSGVDMKRTLIDVHNKIKKQGVRAVLPCSGRGKQSNVHKRWRQQNVPLCERHYQTDIC